MFSPVKAQLPKSIGLVAQLRNLSISPALRVAAQKAPVNDAAKAKKLKATLQKEKKLLTSLQQKLREKNKALKEKAKQAKKEASDKRKEQKALKPYRKLTGFNVYIKEHCSKENPLSEAGKYWQGMSESDKQEYHDKAAKLNAQNLQIWTPEPVRPGNAYANFLKKNWPQDETFEEASKYISREWSYLTESEKQSYAPSSEALEAYKQAHQRWKSQRLSAFK